MTVNPSFVSEIVKYRETNLNSHIRFKLTERGETIWREYWKQYSGNNRDPLLNIPADAEGWRQEQIWTFASVFGPHFSNGFTVPVETPILIETND